MDTPKKAISVYKSRNGRTIYTLKDGQVKCLNRNMKEFLQLAPRHKRFVVGFRGFSAKETKERCHEEIKSAALTSVDALNLVSDERWEKIK